MNDDRLKREIEEALSLEPSPQFAAQVRARIAEGPQPSSAWIRWGVAAAGFALVAVVMALVLPESKETVIRKPVEIAVKIPEKNLETPSVPAPQRPVSAGRTIRPSTPAAAQPEVLIDPREVAGFRKFVAGVQGDRIDVRKLIELQQAAAKTAPIEEIALMPIGELDPIVIDSLTFGPRRNEGGSL